jgi:hypothetical protein
MIHHLPHSYASMMVTSTPISPFTLPVPPPPPVIVLLSATNLDNGNSLVPLLAQDGIIDKGWGQCLPHQQLPKPCYHPYCPTFSRNITPCPFTPWYSPLSSAEPSSHAPSPNHITFAPPVGVAAKMRIPCPKGAVKGTTKNLSPS